MVVVLNLYERDGDRCFDTSPVIDGDGALLGATRMVHITEYEGFHEQGYYAPGDRGAPVYDTTAGRIGIAICYDRHFPEGARMLGLNGAAARKGHVGDLIIIVTYAQYEESELDGFAPKIILCDEKNGIRELIDR
mgnify:CR=1 FL=1